MNEGAHGSGRVETTVQVMLIAAMVAWGANLSVVKVLTGSMDIMVVSAIRMIVAAIALTVIIGRAGLAKVMASRSVWPSLGACALLMAYANQICFVSGMSRTTATNASLVMALGPLVSNAIAAVFAREALGLRRIAGILLGFGGVALVVLMRKGSMLSSSNMGDLLLLLSVFCFASGGLLVQRLSVGLSALEISWVVHLVGAVLLTSHGWVSSASEFQVLASAGIRTWALILFSGAGATALAAIIWNRAIGRIGMARTSMAFYLVPVFGLLIACLVLGEQISRWHVIGLFGVVIGYWLVATEVPRAGSRSIAAAHKPLVRR